MAKGALRNLLVAAAVFLPVFLIASAVELRLRGAPPLEGDFGYHAGSAALIYLTMLLPVALGALVHSAAMLLIPPDWSRRRQRAAAVILSALVPLTVIVLRLPGEGMLSFLLGSATVATLAFGAACTTHVGRKLRMVEGM